MKYWAYINNEVQGPYEKEELLKLSQFSNSTLLCPQSPVGEKTQDWKEAASFPEISAMISEVSARQMQAPPADSGFGNPFHNFGDIEIRAIDESLSSATSSSPSPSPLDPISLSQIGRRQESVFQKDEQLRNDENKTENKQDEQKQSPFLTTSSSSNINEINLQAPQDIAEVSSSGELKKDINPGDIPLAMEKNNPSGGLNMDNPLPDIGSIELPKTNDGVNKAGEIAPESNAVENNSSGGLNIDNPLPDIGSIELPKTNDGVNKAGEIAPESNAVENNPSGGLNTDNPLPDLSPVNSQSIPDISTQMPLPSVEKLNTDINLSGNSLPSSVSSFDSDKIISLIEKFAMSSASKDDISALRSYLDSKIEVLNNRINSFDTEGIKQSIQNIESKISSIEGKINSSQSAKPSMSPSSIEIQPNYDAMVMDKKEPSPPQVSLERPIDHVEPPKATLVQKEEDNKKKEVISSDKGKAVKLILKVVVAVILFAGILIALSLALRSAGVIDVTGYIPFIAPAKKAMNKDIKEDIFQSQPSTSTVPVEISTTASQTGPVSLGKDLSDEVVYFVRNYIKPGETKNLENIIIQNAIDQKLNGDSISWKARKMDEDNYMVIAEFPAPREPVDYIFEVNYKNKNIRPSNNFAALVMDAEHDRNVPKPLEKVVDVKGKKATKINKSRTVRKNKKTSARSKSQIKEGSRDALKNSNNEKTKNDNKKDEEYVYEYEDEGDQEYLMPGIPKI